MKKTEPDVQLVETLSLSDLCQFCGAERSWVIELVEHGALEPDGSVSADWGFTAINIARARKARRLQQDLGVNAAGIAVILDLLEQRNELRRRLLVMDGL